MSLPFQGHGCVHDGVCVIGAGFRRELRAPRSVAVWPHGYFFASRSAASRTPCHQEPCRRGAAQARNPSVFAGLLFLPSSPALRCVAVVLLLPSASLPRGPCVDYGNRHLQRPPESQAESPRSASASCRGTPAPYREVAAAHVAARDSKNCLHSTSHRARPFQMPAPW